MSDLYETLGVARDATPDEVKAAYRRAASAAHPDRHGGSTEDMQAVNAAYDTLRDPEARARYDEDGSYGSHKSIDSQADAYLRRHFEAALDQDLEPVRYAAAQLNTSRTDVGALRRTLNRDIAKAEKRLGKTKVKGKRRNLVEEILRARLVTLNGRLAQCDEAEAVADRAAAVLADYEGESLDPFAGMTDLQRRQQGHALGIANT